MSRTRSRNDAWSSTARTPVRTPTSVLRSIRVTSAICSRHAVRCRSSARSRARAMVHARGSPGWWPPVASALSHAVAPDERAFDSPDTAPLARRVPRLIVGIVGLSVGGAAFVLLATSDHLLHPDAYALLVANSVIGSVAVALNWAARRPGNRLVVALLAYAAAAAMIGLQ